jgi:hypothetical protein
MHAILVKVGTYVCCYRCSSTGPGIIIECYNEREADALDRQIDHDGDHPVHGWKNRYVKDEGDIVYQLAAIVRHLNTLIVADWE